MTQLKRQLRGRQGDWDFGSDKLKKNSLLWPVFEKNSNNYRISAKTTPIKGVQTPPSWLFIVNEIVENPCANCWIGVNWWKPTVRFVKITFRSCSCRLCLHACNRSLFARGLLIDSHAYVISQHVHWPIRTPLPTCANQDAWVVITPKLPKANSRHTAAWHSRS